MAQNSDKQRGRGKPFAKGKSGNPGGRPKEVAEVRALARAYTVEAIETLAGIMRDGDGDRSKAAASEALLNRGWGKPEQAFEVTGKDGEPVRIATTETERNARLLELLGKTGIIVTA